MIPNGESLYRPHCSQNKQNYNSSQKPKQKYSGSPEQKVYSGGSNKFGKQKSPEQRKAYQEEPSYQILKKEKNHSSTPPTPKSPHRNKNEERVSGNDMQKRPDFMPAFNKAIEGQIEVSLIQRKELNLFNNFIISGNYRYLEETAENWFKLRKPEKYL